MSLYITIPNLILDIILLCSAWFIWFELVTAYCLYWIRWDLHSMEANFTVSWSFFIINIIVIFRRGIHFMELSWRYQKSHLFVLNTWNGCLCCSYHGADWRNLVPGKTERRVLQRNGPCSGGSVPLLPAPSQTHFNPSRH